MMKKANFFLVQKKAHIGLARDAAERQKVDGCRFSIPVRCQLKQKNLRVRYSCGAAIQYQST
jgi:hypothetical protein